MKSKIIGITGSIATGKSEVSKYLIKKGYQVIDADDIAHKLMNIGEVNYKAILDNFGRQILDSQNNIDRNKLGNIVFNNKEKLNLLNNLTHNNIFIKINEIINSSSNKLIFVDIPLLIELIEKSKLNLHIDEIWLVYTSKQVQLERLMNRNNLSEEEAIKKINSQKCIEEKIKYADFVLDNSKDREYLIAQIEKRLEKK